MRIKRKPFPIGSHRRRIVGASLPSRLADRMSGGGGNRPEFCTLGHSSSRNLFAALAVSFWIKAAQIVRNLPGTARKLLRCLPFCRRVADCVSAGRTHQHGPAGRLGTPPPLLNGSLLGQRRQKGLATHSPFTPGALLKVPSENRYMKTNRAHCAQDFLGVSL